METELKIVASADRPDPTVAKLANYQFTAKQLCKAVGISGAVLTNYLAKANLKLSSESAGQGRARTFYLIDVYQVALVAGLTRLTGRAGDAAQVVEDFTLTESEPVRRFDKKFARDLPPLGEWIDAREEGSKKILSDIASNHPLYWIRNPQDPCFVGMIYYRAEKSFALMVFPFSDHTVLKQVPEVFLLNATKLLSDVDVRLCELLNLPELKQEPVGGEATGGIKKEPSSTRSRRRNG